MKSKRYWFIHHDKAGRTCDGYITATSKQDACDRLNASPCENKHDYKPSDLRVAKWQ